MAGEKGSDSRTKGFDFRTGSSPFQDMVSATRWLAVINLLLGEGGLWGP